MKIIRNALLVLGFSLLLSGLAVPAGAALKEGCNPDFNKNQQNHANAIRVRDKAYTRETVKRNDTALGMTCFDQAMGLTSRLGLIFSDVIPDVPPPPNTTVFTPPLAYPEFGADEYLIEALGDVVEPVLSSYLDDFVGTASDLLGLGTATSLFSAILGGITGTIGSITGLISGFLGTITTLNGWISTITGIANTLSLPLPAAAIMAVTAFLNTVQSTISTMMSSIQSAMSAAIMPVINSITSYIAGPATDMTCDRIEKLWSTATPTADAAPIEGAGIEGGTPYFEYEKLLTGAPAGVGSDLLAELTAGTNGTILSDAMADLTGPLAAPGTLSSWKIAPIFPAGTGTAAIIGGM